MYRLCTYRYAVDRALDLVDRRVHKLGGDARARVVVPKDGRLQLEKTVRGWEGDRRSRTSYPPNVCWIGLYGMKISVIPLVHSRLGRFLMGGDKDDDRQVKGYLLVRERAERSCGHCVPRSTRRWGRSSRPSSSEWPYAFACHQRQGPAVLPLRLLHPLRAAAAE
jgi:hypothetical protein